MISATETDVGTELVAMGLKLQELGCLVLVAVAERDPDMLMEAVTHREQILDRLRELARTNPRQVAACAELRAAVKEETQVAVAAQLRLQELRQELQDVSQRIALRQTYGLTPDRDDVY
jgi:hypothetical protein